MRVWEWVRVGCSCGASSSKEMPSASMEMRYLHETSSSPSVSTCKCYAVKQPALAGGSVRHRQILSDPIRFNQIPSDPIGTHRNPSEPIIISHQIPSLYPSIRSRPIPPDPVRSRQIQSDPAQSHQIHQIPSDPIGSHQIPSDPIRPHRIPSDPIRSHRSHPTCDASKGSSATVITFVLPSDPTMQYTRISPPSLDGKTNELCSPIRVRSTSPSTPGESDGRLSWARGGRVGASRTKVAPPRGGAHTLLPGTCNRWDGLCVRGW